MVKITLDSSKGGVVEWEDATTEDVEVIYLQFQELLDRMFRKETLIGKAKEIIKGSKPVPTNK